MFDKIATMDSYMEKLYESLNLLNLIIKETNRNLLLINVNSPYVSKLIYSRVNINKIDCRILSQNEYDSYGSLGAFLQFAIANANACKVLILDFVNELSELLRFSNKVVDEININRDLFTQKFDSVIVISPPRLCYEIMSNAAYFWSCVDNYIDTSRWFCCPLQLPTIKVRIYAALYEQNLLNFYKKIKIPILSMQI